MSISHATDVISSRSNHTYDVLMSLYADMKKEIDELKAANTVLAVENTRLVNEAKNAKDLYESLSDIEMYSIELERMKVLKARMDALEEPAKKKMRRP